LNFDLTTEQQMIRDLVADFADKEVAPGAVERDLLGEFPREIFKQLGELGLMGLPYAEEYGGGGADTVSFAIVTEELSRVCGSTGIGYSAHISLGGSPLNLFGTHEQKLEYLTPVCRGEYMGAFGLTEPSAGSDAGGTRTTAEDKGDYWLLNGSKCFITNAGFAKNLSLTAVTDREAGTRGISAFIVPTDAKGFTVNDHYKKMGLHASNTTELVLENVEIPKENLLGDLGKGFKQFLQVLDGGRIGIGAMAVGIAQGALNKAVAYAKERIQFGTSISKFQAIQFKLADIAMNVEIARNMVFKAAWLKDQGRAYSREAAIAKLFATEMCMKACDQAVQIHGGYGYMVEYEVERFMRDAKLLEIGEGTSEVQRMVIAKSLGC
jgi:alkylation response protein AidB-like acyl-CoA dehydrogenase